MRPRAFCRINKQWGKVIALEQLTSHIEQAHNNRDPSPYDNSTWHVINTGYINSSLITTIIQSQSPNSNRNRSKGMNQLIYFLEAYCPTKRSQFIS